MDFGKLLKRSFEITIRYRALWLFGILLALFGGRSGSSFNLGNLSGFGGSPGGGRGGNLNPNVTPPSIPPAVAQTILAIVCLVACIIVIWIILSIILRFVSRAALISSVRDLESGQVVPTVGNGFRVGADRFLSLLGIALIINVPLTLVSLILIFGALAPFLFSLIPLIGSNPQQPPPNAPGVFLSGLAGSFVLICCFVIGLILVQLIFHPFYEFITRVCVIDKRGVADSIVAGYRLVRANLGKVALLYLLAIGIGIGYNIVMLFVSLVLIGVPVGVGILAYLLANSVGTGIVVGLIVLIPMLIVLLFIGGLYQVFESTFWTEGFLEIRSAPAEAAPAAPVAPAPTTAAAT